MNNKIKVLILAILVTLNIDAQDTNTSSNQQSELEEFTQKNRGFQSDETSSTYTTFDDAIDSNRSADWNTANWRQQSANNGANTGSIGKMQSFFGVDSSSVDVNKARSDNIRNDESAPDNLKVWTQDFQDELASSAIRNNNLEVGQTIKCYITRDIPIRYKCSKTHMSYGGFINSNGLEAKNKCESECYEQSQCVEIEEPIVETENIQSIVIDENTKINQKTINLTGALKWLR